VIVVVRKKAGKAAQATEDVEDVRSAERVLERVRSGEERTIPLTNATKVWPVAQRKRGQ